MVTAVSPFLRPLLRTALGEVGGGWEASFAVGPSAEDYSRFKRLKI